MITVKGYSEVGYDTLYGRLFDAFKRSGKTYFKVAQEMNVNSTQTAINAISNPNKVSDSTLTDAMRCVGLDGFVLISQGLKYYYVKNK